MGAVGAHEADLTAYALGRLAEVPGLTIHGPQEPDGRGPAISFALEGVHPHDVAEILGRDGVCVRAGHHCAQPLMRKLGVAATSRASFGVHNTRADVDRLVDALAEVRRIFA
jgi:cysteine desulfurase/selenocysteine lyase